MKKERGTLRREIRESYRDDPRLFWAYIILRLFVIVTLARCVVRGDYEGAFLSMLVLFIYMLPSVFERRLGIDIPNTLEIILLCFVFAAEIQGEIYKYYVTVAHWDTILHTTWGFLAAAVGYSLADLLNKSERVKISLSPVFLAVTAFCFSMTIGVLWEFFEFAADRFLLKDVQKDTVVHLISSVTLDPTNSNVPVVIRNITDAGINGESLGLGGYLDIGLYDTMEDLMVNFIGALVFSVAGFFEAKSKKPFLTRALTPHWKKRREPSDGDGN